MQLIISSVTPLDWARQVEYSCVISLSAAATSGLPKKSTKLITVTFLVQIRSFAMLLSNFGIILGSLFADLRTHHWPPCQSRSIKQIPDRRPEVGPALQQPAACQRTLHTSTVIFGRHPRYTFGTMNAQIER